MATSGIRRDNFERLHFNVGTHVMRIWLMGSGFRHDGLPRYDGVLALLFCGWSRGSSWTLPVYEPWP